MSRSPHHSPPSSPSQSSSKTPQASPSPTRRPVSHWSSAGTMFELVKDLNDGARVLNTRSTNPISLNAGCELFITFVTLFPHDSVSFADLKTKLIRQGQQYAKEALTYRQKIAELAASFIKDGSIVFQFLYPPRRPHCSSSPFKVFVTEARPRGLGSVSWITCDTNRSNGLPGRIKTAEALTAAGIPSTVILDSAVAYVMEKVDFVLVGSEAVVESGGLINAVGSNQIAIIAKAANKPFYALAERLFLWLELVSTRLITSSLVSYKFHRLFPLSQYDLPNQNARIFSFSRPKPVTSPRPHPQISAPSTDSGPLDTTSSNVAPTTITQEQISQNNPEVDYTRWPSDYLVLLFGAEMRSSTGQI
ncbi:hypothetical protein C0992_010878 [Termitomyces sp. T32_za158]|nr:hypothetical protein C0992_010878 [Termitomyces sp. T32_za158]